MQTVSRRGCEPKLNPFAKNRMPPSPPPLETAGTKYALIIGVDNLRDRAIPSLRYAKNDARALRDFLLHPDLGKFQRENVHILLDEEATLGDIRSQFVYWLGAKVQETDQVWIYFAGYGATFAEGREAKHLLVAHDTALEDLAQSSITFEQLEEWFGLVAAQRMVLILDCGFHAAGRGRALSVAARARATEYSFAPLLLNDARRLALVAAGPSENAREDDEAELGLFTRILLQRLRATLLANYGPELTWEALQQYLAAEVSRQADLRGSAQTPQMIGGVPSQATLFGEAPQPRVKAAGISTPERVQQLLREAQQQIHADKLELARKLLLEILTLDANNRRARNGLRKLEEVLQRNGDGETQIKHAFTQAQRYWDERDYQEAQRWYEKVLELDPTSESARVGVETCRTMLQKHEEETAANGATTAVRTTVEKAAHAPKIEAYGEFIWPFIGWWALIGAVWGLFGTHNDGASNAAIFVTVVEYGIVGGLIGLVHASATYFYKLTQLRMKLKKTRRA